MSALPDPESCRFLCIEVCNARTPIEKKPEWIRTTAVTDQSYWDMCDLSHHKGPYTVCMKAGCPDIHECWRNREATFLLDSAVCTRCCDFCNIATERPSEYNQDKPRRIAESVAQLELRYATITGVARDDLPDSTAWLYAEAYRRIYELSPLIGVELLADDFRGHNESIDMVIEAAPQVFAHSLEMVPRIFKKAHPIFRCERSLTMIQRARGAGMVMKSDLIPGMGKAREEVSEALHDSHFSGYDLLAITQYLRPSALRHPINRRVHPEEFLEIVAKAEGMGFVGVMARPLVRSSYRADLLQAKGIKAHGFEIPTHFAHLDDSASTLQETGTVLVKLRERRERRATVREKVGV